MRLGKSGPKLMPLPPLPYGSRSRSSSAKARIALRAIPTRGASRAKSYPTGVRQAFAIGWDSLLYDFLLARCYILHTRAR